VKQRALSDLVVAVRDEGAGAPVHGVRDGAAVSNFVSSAAAALFAANVVSLASISPVGKENDVLSGKEHDVASGQLIFADLVGDLAKSLGDVAVAQTPAEADVARAVASERTAVGARTTAVRVALTVRDLAINPILSTSHDGGTSDAQQGSDGKWGSLVSLTQGIGTFRDHLEGTNRVDAEESQSHAEKRGATGRGAATETKHQVEGGLLLDVVVSQGTAIFELLAGEDETLLIGGNTFLVLDLLFHILDGVRGLHIESDGLAREGLDEDLHARHFP